MFFRKKGHTNSARQRMKEEMNMEKCNECIKCTVDNCKHHHNTKNYCTLASIEVGTHEANPTKDQCTDCLSYMKR